MTDVAILRDLGWVVAAAALLLAVARRLSLPPILAFMAAGLLLGPLLGVLPPSASLDLLSELGVTLLLFVVGLELGVDRLRAAGATVLAVGVAQVGLTAGAGFLVASAAGAAADEAFLLGLVVAFSSTVVVVKLLDRTREMDAPHGRLAVGILLVQDALVAVVLTGAGGLGGEGTGGAGLAAAAIGIAGLGLVAVAGARFLLPPLFDWLARSPEALLVIGVAWALAFLRAAETLHVSVELGALIAGVAIAQLPANRELRRRIHPLVDLFLAVFFVTLGAGMEPGAALGRWPLALALAALTILGKPALVAGLLALSPRARGDAFRAGLTLGQVSEFGLVLSALAASRGLVGPDVPSLVGVLALITIGASAVLVPRGPTLVSRLPALRMGARAGADALPSSSPASAGGHVVVVGMNALGRRLADALVSRGERVLAVDTDPRKLAGLAAPGLAGSVDDPAVLREAGVSTARLVVSTLRIEEANNLLAHRCRREGVPVSVHAFDPSLTHELLEIGADHLMISKLDGIADIEAAIRAEGVLG